MCMNLDFQATLRNSELHNRIGSSGHEFLLKKKCAWVVYGREKFPCIKKLLFVKDGDRYRKPKWVKMQNCGAPPHLNRYIYNTTLASKAQGSVLKQGQKDLKSHRIRDFAKWSCLIVMSEATPKKSHQHEYPNVSWKCTAIRDILMWMWGQKALTLHKELQAIKKGWEWK